MSRPTTGSTWSPRNLPSDWRARRAFVARLYGYKCAVCGFNTARLDERDPMANGECDHIGDSDDHRIVNLRWLDRSCHAKRTQAQAQAGRTGARVCQHCPAEIPPRAGRGRPAAYCSPACRRKARSAQDRAERQAKADMRIYQEAAAHSGLRAELAAVTGVTSGDSPDDTSGKPVTTGNDSRDRCDSSAKRNSRCSAPVNTHLLDRAYAARRFLDAKAPSALVNAQQRAADDAERAAAYANLLRSEWFWSHRR